MQNRSYQAELLDAADIPKEDLYRNLHELNTINTLLGGHAVTLKALKAFRFEPNTTYRLLDIGCGGGDNLKVIANWARKSNLLFELVGVDLKEDCIAFAQKQCADYPEIKFICSDYKYLLNTDTSFDIIFSALFCHHFREEELSQLIDYKRRNSKMGFFINDLHRNAIAYYSIKWLTRFFSKSYLVKNDAPLSVQRGFRKTDWLNIIRPIGNTRIKWAWAFRWLIIETKPTH